VTGWKGVRVIVFVPVVKVMVKTSADVESIGRLDTGIPPPCPLWPGLENRLALSAWV
jgi:hypothetical protein